MKRLTALAAFFMTSAVLLGQGEVLGVGNFIHVVADLDKSIEFYRDSIGLELTGAPGPRAFSANAIVSSLYDAPGAQSRVASFRIPGSEMAVEIVEFKDLHATAVRPGPQDPGAITLILSVRKVEAALAALKVGNVEIVSSGPGEVLTRDPDGIFVRLTERGPAPSSTVPASSNVIGAGFGITVADLDKTLRFYREALGFPYSPDGARAVNGPVARTTLLVPGSAFPVEFAEWNVKRQPAHAAIHDPGAGVLRLRVRDLDAVVKALKAAGAPIVSAGGKAVSLGRGRAVIVRELNNVFLQAMQAAQ